MGFLSSLAGTKALKANETKFKKKNLITNIKRRQNLKEVGAKFIDIFIQERQSGKIQLSSGSSGAFIQFSLKLGEKARE